MLLRRLLAEKNLFGFSEGFEFGNRDKAAEMLSFGDWTAYEKISEATLNC